MISERRQQVDNLTSLAKVIVEYFGVNANATPAHYKFAEKALTERRVQDSGIKLAAKGQYCYINDSAEARMQLEHLMKQAGLLKEEDLAIKQPAWLSLNMVLRQNLAKVKDLKRAYSEVSAAKDIIPYLKRSDVKPRSATMLRIGEGGVVLALTFLEGRGYKLKKRETANKGLKDAGIVEEFMSEPKPEGYADPEVVLPQVRPTPPKERRKLISSLKKMPEGTYLSASELVGRYAISPRIIGREAEEDGVLGPIGRGGPHGRILGWPKERVIELEELILTA